MNRLVRLLLLVWLALLGAGAMPVDAAAPYGWVRPSDGRPVTWNNSQPIPYSIDQGPLGRLSNADAAALVQTAFQRWAGVDTASISFAAAAPLTQDLTGANVLAFLNSLPAGVNPIIFDTDGSVMQTLLGDPAAAVAFGRPLTVDPTAATITSGFVVLNGLYIDGRFNPDDLSLDDFRGMAVQEIGRFLGLGYSQLNTALILDGDASNNPLVPQMYAVPVPGNSDQLTTDDRAALAALYPNPNNASTGTIRGQVLLPDGTTGLQGINIIARRVGDPNVTAVSAISGMQFKNEIGPTGLDGSRQPALRGAYTLNGLPPGMYALTLEALRPESQAGPGTPRREGGRQPAFLPGGTQYFRIGGAATTDPNAASTIAVSAGQVVENVNIVVAAPAGPPVQTITQQEPNEFPEQAPTLPPSARVQGSVQPGDASGVSAPLAGGNAAAIQDLYRLAITQPTIVTATLSAATAGADLNLFLLSGPVATAPQVVAASTDAGTPPETFQRRLAPGIYYLGVSLAGGTGTAYTLDVNSTPAPDSTTPAPPKPRLNNLVVGNVTPTSADTDFGSDLPSNTLFYVSNPLTEFSNTTVATDHRQSFTGLAAGTSFRVRTMAVTPATGVGTLPDVFFTTASPALPGGVGQISAGIVDIIDDPADPNAEYVVVSFRNVGTGDASGVAISTLTAPTGWTFSNPLGTPANLGFIGRGGSGLLVTRVQRAAGTASARRAHIASLAAPIISGTGSYFSPGVGQQTFTFGGVVPSLVLSKSASPSTPKPGDVVTFTLTATNQGMGPATGVVISDALPAGMTFVPSTGGGQLQNGTVFFSLGTLAAGASRTVSFQAAVNAGTAGGTTITNVALLRSNENPNALASNVVPVNVTAPPPPPPPQLQLSKSANLSSAQPGQTITYTLSYVNAGTSPASNVLLTDPLPPGTVLAGAPGGVLTTANGTPAVIWALGSLAPGSSGSRTLQLTVAPTTPGGTAITNTAQIAATEAPTPVTATAAPVQVTAQPQLTIVKSANRSQVQPGDLIAYTVTVSNPGSGPATNVQLSDPIPAGTSFSGFADAFSSGGALQGATLVWSLGTLAPNASASVSFRVQVQPTAGSAGPINNVAQVTSAEIQTPLQSNQVSVSVVAPPPPPQLQIVKSANRSSVQAGQSIQYSITVNNVGAGAATGVQIADAVPAGTNYIPGSADNNGGPIDASTIGWSFGTLPAGASVTVSFQVQVVATSGAINNVAQVRSAEITAPVPSNQGNPVVVTVTSLPQLQIQKSVVGSPNGAPGSLITYQLSFTNAFGGGTATNVTVQDQAPANTSFASLSTGGFVSGVTAIWNVGTLQPGQSGSVTLQVRVNPGVPNGTPITNTGQVSSAEVPTPVASNPVTVTVAAPPPAPQFSISKQQDVSNAAPGGTVNYQITVSNSGGPATNVTVSDPIPTGMTAVAALDGGAITPGGFGSPAVATWNLGTLGSGASRLVRLQVRVNNNAGGTITNVAQVMSVEAPTPVNSNGVTVTVAPPPNLSIQKMLSPAKPTAAPGDTLQYVLSYQNNGSAAVSGAAVVDTIPANTQLTAASPGGTVANGVITWNLGSLNPGQSGQVVLQVQVLPNTPDQTQISNQAQITVAAQQYSQSSSTVTTTVVVPPPPLNLAIQKAVDKPTAMPGDTLTYTISFKNNGAGTASGAAIVDPIPANTQLTAASPGATAASGVLTWNLGPLGPNQSGQVIFQAKVLPGTPDQTAITNQAQITVAAQQYSQSSNTVSTTVSVPPSLTLSKSVDKPSAAPGATLTYTLTFSNTGAQSANQVVLLDPLPSGVTFGGTASPGGQLVSGTPPNNGLFVRFNLGTVAAGASGSVQFTVTVNNNVSAGATINNQATISAAGLPQPITSNTTTTTVSAAPLNLAIQKAVDKPTAAPGATLTYTLSFKNNGSQAVSGAVVSDTLPANTQFVNASAGFSSAGNTINWSLGAIGANQSGQLVLQVRVLPGTPDQTAISNTAQIAVGAQQYTQTSNTATTTVVVPPPPLNLAIQKAVDKPTAMPGDTLTYTISFKNNGAGTVTGAAVTDSLPANTQLSGPPPGATLSNGVLTWPLSSLAANQSGQVSFQVQVLPGTPNQTQISNQAQIVVAAQQYSQTSNTASTTVAVPPPPLNLSIQKVVDKPAAMPGDTLQYTITYKNNGAGPVSGAAVVDPIPANVQPTAATQGFTSANGALTWNLPTLNPGQSGQLILRVSVLAGTPDQTVITNTAQITVAAQQYSQSSTATTTVMSTTPPAGLMLSKTVDKASAANGDTLTYTLSYANQGSQTIHQVEIVDPLPTGVTFVSAANGGQVTAGAVHFPIGDLAAQASGTVSFQVTVNAGLPGGTVIMNQATISGQGVPQPVSSNSVSTTVGTTSSSLSGTWFTEPAGGNALSLTVDPGGRFTIWAVAADRALSRAAQGKLNSDATFEATSADNLVHFSGGISADRQSAKVTVTRQGLGSYVVTAPRAPDVAPLPSNRVGSYNGSAQAANGDRIQVRLSIDPGGNSTLEAEVLQSNSPTLRLQFAHLFVTADGRLTNPADNSQVGILQVQNQTLVLSYNFQHAGPPPYQNTFQVPLQPFTP